MPRRRLVARLSAPVPEELVDFGRAAARTVRDEQLDRVEGARPDLDLLRRAVLDQLLRVDPGHELRLEAQDSVEAEHVGDEVVGEHRELIEVVHDGDADPRDVGGGDLCALEERDREPVVDRAVGEAIPLPEPGRQGDSRPAGGVGDVSEAAVVMS